MTRPRKHKIIARIFEDSGGWYFCPETGPLDTRARRFDNKISTIRFLRHLVETGQVAYTHYRCGLGRDRAIIRSDR